MPAVVVLQQTNDGADSLRCSREGSLDEMLDSNADSYHDTLAYDQERNGVCEVKGDRNHGPGDVDLRM